MRTVVGLVVVLLLSSCATISAPTPRTLALWQLHRNQVVQLRDWELRGKIAVSTEDEGWSGTVIWQQHGDRYHLRFTAPLGQGSMQLSGQPGYAHLRTSDGGDFRAANPDALVREVLDMVLPVSNLPMWVCGLPDVNSHADILGINDTGQLTHLKQAGWKIEFNRYQTVGSLSLPTKIDLENDQFTVKIVIRNWQFNPQQIHRRVIST